MRSFPQTRRFSTVALLATAFALALVVPARAAEPSASEMKPYVESIAGTNLTFEMVPIPGGKFVMGSPSIEAKRSDEEGPQHDVEIAPFWMGKYEVSWDEFDEFGYSLDLKRKSRAQVDLKKQVDTEVAADAVTRPTPPYADMTFGYGHKGQPAICMTHHAAMEFCRWLSAKTGQVYRLPTEAEWEYACRAGTKTAYFFGDDPKQAGDYAWYVENAEKPMPIGKKKPNPWGLHDIVGNVSEWCLDQHVADIYSKRAMVELVKGPVELPSAKEYPYVARGGSWDDDPDRLRSAARLSSNLEWSVQDPQRPQSIWWHTDAHFIGLRVVRPLQEQEDLKGLKSPIMKGKNSR